MRSKVIENAENWQAVAGEAGGDDIAGFPIEEIEGEEFALYPRWHTLSMGDAFDEHMAKAPHHAMNNTIAVMGGIATIGLGMRAATAPKTVSREAWASIDRSPIVDADTAQGARRLPPSRLSDELAPVNKGLHVGAVGRPGGGRFNPINPSGRMDNCVAGVCALLRNKIERRGDAPLSADEIESMFGWAGRERGFPEFSALTYMNSALEDLGFQTERRYPLISVDPRDRLPATT